MNFISFQYLKKHYFRERERKNGGKMVSGQAQKGPHCKGFPLNCPEFHSRPHSWKWGFRVAGLP